VRTLGERRFTERTLAPVWFRQRMYKPNDFASLVGWYRAQDLALSATDPVPTWSDISGNGNDFTQGTSANQPTYQTNVLNGYPVVRFDATNDGMVSSISFGAGTEFSIIYVANYTNGAVSARRAVQGSVNWLMGPYGAVWQMNTGGGFSSTTIPANSNFVVHGISVDVGVGFNQYTFDRKVAFTGAGTGSPSLLRLGAVGAFAEPFGGDMAELAIFSDNLDDSQMRGLVYYFQNKYDIVLTP
jgi:hypothetical protein